jgi:hypothetical protein
MQVPIAVDHAPTTQKDSFVVSLDSQSSLNVLANDYAAFGTLEVSSTTAGSHGVALRCPNNYCILYSPGTRFSGFDQLSYTAKDLRGRAVHGTALIRLQTTPPKLLGLPKHADIIQASLFPVFAGSTVSYEDTVWQLTANVSVELDIHAGPSEQWPAGVLSLGILNGSAATAVSTVASQSRISVLPSHQYAVSSVLTGNRSSLGDALKELVLTLPPTYSGGALVQLQLCSQWMECTVRTVSPCQTLHCKLLSCRRFVFGIPGTYRGSMNSSS